MQQRRRHVGDGTRVEAALVRPLERPRRRRQQIVPQPGLVVDHGNVAHRILAESVLRRRIGDAVLPREDVERRPVALSDHLIQRPAVLGVQQPRRAVRRDARRAAFPVDVARPLAPPGKPIAGEEGGEEDEGDEGGEEEVFLHGIWESDVLLYKYTLFSRMQMRG